MRPPASPDARSGAARRAAPRVTYIAVLVVVLVWSWHERWSGAVSAIVVGAGSVALVLAVGRCLKPAWLHYVRTGEEPPGWLASESGGGWDVVLEAPGRRPIEIMHVVRQATGCPLDRAREAVEAAPSTVANDVGEPAADRLVAALLSAGASVRKQPGG